MHMDEADFWRWLRRWHPERTASAFLPSAEAGCIAAWDMARQQERDRAGGGEESGSDG